MSIFSLILSDGQITRCFYISLSMRGGGEIRRTSKMSLTVLNHKSKRVFFLLSRGPICLFGVDPRSFLHPARYFFSCSPDSTWIPTPVFGHRGCCIIFAIATCSKPHDCVCWYTLFICIIATFLVYISYHYSRRTKGV